MSIFRRSDSARKERTPEPVKVAWAGNVAEADLIADILRQEGIPSLIKRNKGFDVPDFLAAGARDIFVPASAADRAREILDDLKAGEEQLPGS